MEGGGGYLGHWTKEGGPCNNHRLLQKSMEQMQACFFFKLQADKFTCQVENENLVFCFDPNFNLKVKVLSLNQYEQILFATFRRRRKKYNIKFVDFLYSPDLRQKTNLLLVK